MLIKVKKLHPDATMPTKATDGSACWDVYAIEDIVCKEYRVTPIRTGLAFEVPEGYFLDIRPRSGLSMLGALIANTPGTLDSDYRGELLVLIYPLVVEDDLLSELYAGHSMPKHTALVIEKGNRMAQVRLAPVIAIEFVEYAKLSETDRGDDGFGSSGR